MNKAHIRHSSGYHYWCSSTQEAVQRRQDTKQARGRARGAGGECERDEWCRSRCSGDKFEAMIASKVCLFRLLCDRDSSVRLGDRAFYIAIIAPKLGTTTVHTISDNTEGILRLRAQYS